MRALLRAALGLPGESRPARPWPPGRDLGLFGPGSMVWRVHGDPATLVGGLRAVLVQALHPVAMAAVDQHSSYRDDPWGRLARTSEYLARTTYGDTATALEAAARLRSLHARISGVDPVTGRAYRADDPDLLAWVHNAEVHSFLTAYRAYARPLSEAEADRYVTEMVTHAGLVGLPRDAVPSTLSGLRAYLRSRTELALTPAARAGARLVLSPPLPASLRPAWALVSAAAVALLPARIRALYGLAWTPVAAPAVRAAARALLGAMRVALPPPPHLQEARGRARRLAGAA